MDRRYIPKYLNAQPQILWWDLSEFIVFLLILSVGVLGNFPFTSAFIGVIALRIMSKMGGKKEAGYYRHLAYAKGLYGVKGRVPEFWIKEIGR